MKQGSVLSSVATPCLTPLVSATPATARGRSDAVPTDVSERFGFYWNAQQHYLGPIITYALSQRWSVRLEPAIGLSNVSDPLVLRAGIALMIGPPEP